MDKNLSVSRPPDPFYNAIYVGAEYFLCPYLNSTLYCKECAGHMSETLAVRADKNRSWNTVR